MQRRFDSRFDVVRVGPFRVAAGGQVTVSDPFLHTALRSTAPPLVRLRFGGASLEADVQPASFGPSFNETLQRLPLAELVLPPADNEHGCEPYIVNGGSVIVLKRGECTFGRKASAVTVMGEAVILVVDDGDGVLPVADGDAENEARVPLGMVSAKTGATLDRMVMAAGGEGVRVQAVDVKEKTEEVIINGYRLRNLRLVP